MSAPNPDASSPSASTGSATAESQPRRGIDVSHFSGTVDWAGVEAAGFCFAYVKATEGLDYTDPAFATNWQGLAGTGLLRGAYHFYVTEDDPVQQANFFLATAKPAAGDLLPVVDIETIGQGTQPGLADRLRRFLAVVQAAIGVRPMIYTAPSFWNANLTPDFGAYPLWVAEYGVETPKIPAGWTSWALWQSQDAGSVPGVEHDADLDQAHPDLDLQSLRIPGAGGCPPKP